jgi:hypothetical protein
MKPDSASHDPRVVEGKPQTEARHSALENDACLPPAEKPILFSAPMVRAILAGEKTQTRRALKPQPQLAIEDSNPKRNSYEWKLGMFALDRYPSDSAILNYCPYGKAGDRLWVKENYRFIEHGQFGAIRYEADGAIMPMPTAPCWGDDPHAWWSNGFDKHGDKLRPCIFLPKWASRIHLEITEVRVERLQDITESDARAEGVRTRFDATSPDDYASLWDSINADKDGGIYAWHENPWVWVLSFKPVERVSGASEGHAHGEPPANRASAESTPKKGHEGESQP